MDDTLLVTSTALGTTLEQWYNGQASRPLLPSEQPPRVPHSMSEKRKSEKCSDVADTLAEASRSSTKTMLWRLSSGFTVA